VLGKPVPLWVRAPGRSREAITLRETFLRASPGEVKGTDGGWVAATRAIGLVWRSDLALPVNLRELND